MSDLPNNVMSIKAVPSIKHEPSEGLLGFADELEELAKAIRTGEVVAVALAAVEHGADVTCMRRAVWDSRAITLVGCLHTLATDVTAVLRSED